MGTAPFWFYSPPNKGIPPKRVNNCRSASPSSRRPFAKVAPYSSSREGEQRKDILGGTVLSVVPALGPHTFSELLHFIPAAWSTLQYHPVCPCNQYVGSVVDSNGRNGKVSYSGKKERVKV